MKKYLFLISGLLAVGYLAYCFRLFSFVLLAVIAIILVYLLLMGAVKLFWKKTGRKWFQVPLAIAAIALVGLGIGLFRPLPAPIVGSNEVGKTLEYAYSTDQGDRQDLKFYIGVFRERMKERDSTRLEQVKQLYARERIIEPLDKFHAAFILHHNYSRDSALYRLAHSLAKEAASDSDLREVFQVQWLAKATYDRWMLSIGKEQKYDTQGGVSFEIQ